jgi:hypothetical protein
MLHTTKRTGGHWTRFGQVLFFVPVAWILAVTACDGEEGRTVEIPEAMQRCAADQSCSVVETDCASCCDFAAVSSGLLAEFERLYADTCKGYSGPVCECMPPGRPKGECVRDRCTVVYEPWPQ